ncbi:MAG: T9SS type A sorting domain-containing protein [Kordia sp.]|uniref:T9SS type A sorting domain-containing protein n=1 Tax=Kordia sp. TaxID=1965332 RepID=UPI00385FD882
MKTNLVYKTLITALTLFSFFYSTQSNAQCTLQVFPNVVNNDCQNANKAEVSAVGIFGTPPYTAVWTNAMGTLVETDTNLLQGQASNASDLAADTYTVTFTDATGSCQVSANISVGNITIDTSTTVNSGTITANATGVTYQWVNCDTMSDIMGENGNSYTPTLSGNYAVRLTSSTCVDTSDCVAITTLGITENSFSDTFNVYPNPTSGNFSIAFDKIHANLNVVLYSMTGKVIQKENVENASQIQLNIDSAVGIYILKIIGSNGETSFIKVIKK